MNEPKILHLTANETTAAITLLQNELGLSVAKIKQLGRFGCVWWQAKQQKPVRIRRLKKVLTIGQQIHCYYDPAIIEQPIVPALCIADKQNFSIWLKPRGMFSQATKWGDANSISRFVEQELSRPTWLIHRLDRMTTGLMILSHNKALVAKFSETFGRDDVQKTYVAIVTGKLSDLPMTITTPLAGKASQTEIKFSHYSEEQQLSLVCVQIHSGRKHQIRQHLSEIGCPVIGDRLYGKATEDSVDLQLVAQELRFKDPVDGNLCHYALDEKQLKTLLHRDYHGLVSEMFGQKVLK